MKITSPGEYLTQISFGDGFVPLNCYLVQEQDGLTLIDTALRFMAKSLAQVIRSKGHALRRVVITHGHFDHADGIEPILRAFPDAELLISQREFSLMTGDRRPAPTETPVRGSFYQLKRKPARLLQAGDQVASLEVIAAPGHSPGLIALHDKRDNTLIVGDAFHSVGGLVPVTRFRPFFPWPWFANWNTEVANNTCEKLLALIPARIAPGHGPVVEMPAASLAL
jgi:glyoxylase-like metal-dependent hydrolase (beta-lactamase superfamily II)